MKPLPTLARRMEGTIVLFALIVVLVGTLVLAGWVQMLATRVEYIDHAMEGQKRRLAVLNSRSLARQYMLSGMRSGDFAFSNASISGGWGAFAIANNVSGVWSNTNFFNGNHFSPMGNRAFSVTVPTILSWVGDNGSSGSETWEFRLRSRSPLLGGFPLVVHRSGPTPTFSQVPSPRIFWTDLVGFSGFPAVPITSGSITGAVSNSYNGSYAAPQMSGMPMTAMSNVTAVLSGTNATLTINSSQTESILRYDVPNTWATNYTISGTNYTSAAVRTLVINHAAVTNIAYITINSTNTNLNTVTLSGNPGTNSRQIYIYCVNRSLVLSLGSYSGGDWRLSMSLSNTPLTVTNSSSHDLRLVGGIRTDSTVTLAGTRQLSIQRETNSQALEYVVDRVLWLESYRVP